MNDIEVLEWFLRICDEDLYTEISIRCDGRMRKAIENLLTRNKDLEEINEAHKKENGELREEIEYWKEQAQGYSDLSKQIKEEYEQRLEDYYNEE